MKSMQDEQTEYGEDLIARFELKWGEGFMSPGGSSEVREILGDLQLEGKRILDFGCGLGGAELVLAGELYAGSVVGLDIDAGLICKARALAKQHKLDGKVAFVKAEPGTLEFENDSFDVIFSKDAILHIENKRWIYEEFSRLLRPGGSLTISDWLAHEGDGSALERLFDEKFGLTVFFQTQHEVRELLDSIGFSDINIVDRNAWFRELVKWEFDQFSGPRRHDFVEAFGEEAAQNSVDNHAKLVSLAESGQLRPTHVRASWRG